MATMLKHISLLLVTYNAISVTNFSTSCRTYLDRNFGLSELAGHNDNGGILSKALL